MLSDFLRLLTLFFIILNEPCPCVKVCFLLNKNIISFLHSVCFYFSAPVVQRVPLSFEHAYDADRAAKNRKDLQRSLMEICESTKSGVQPETPRLFTALVYTMKTMEAADMGVVYQKVMSGAICSENQERVK